MRKQRIKGLNKRVFKRNLKEVLKPKFAKLLDHDDVFELRYKHIPRTEYLDLPTWEEAKNGIEYHFYAPKGNTYLLSTKVKVGYSIEKENPYIIRVERIGYSNSEQDFEFTKENYIKACELARKLFLGEVEE